MVCRRRHLLRYFSGVLVRLTTCEMLTNSLPKLSLITLPPLKRRDSRSAGYIYGRTCQYPSGFIFWGYRGEYFSSSTWGKSEKMYYCGWWDMNLRPEKPMVGRRRHLLRYFSGVLVRLTTCNRLPNSLPKLSLMAYMPNTLDHKPRFNPGVATPSISATVVIGRTDVRERDNVPFLAPAASDEVIQLISQICTFFPKKGKKDSCADSTPELCFSSTITTFPLSSLTMEEEWLGFLFNSVPQDSGAMPQYYNVRGRTTDSYTLRASPKYQVRYEDTGDNNRRKDHKVCTLSCVEAEQCHSRGSRQKHAILH